MGTVTVVGLGYVGLPLACRCAAKGHTVFGLDIDQSRISAVNKGKSPIADAYVSEHLQQVKVTATDDPKSCIPESDVVLVCVPTPVNEDLTPNLRALKSAITNISPLLKKDALVVVESTIYPGTIEEVVLPLLPEVLIAHCPERIDPGNKKWTIENLPRVVGGVSTEATEKAAAFYKTIIEAEITVLSSVKAAEATKIMENTFRDVNIAFVNEMAMSFDKAGIDIQEVIKGASTKPFAFMPHYPGAGVGGHCISVDPYYLIARAKQFGFNHRFLSLAREINENMPKYTVGLLEELGDLKGQKVGVLGLAYKPDVDDTRESPSLKVVEALKNGGALVETFDPHVDSSMSSLDNLLSWADAVVLVTAHTEFRELAADLAKHKISTVIDGRNCLDSEAIKKLGITYRGIGRR